MRLVSPPRKYYKFRTEQQISDCEPMFKTRNRFTNRQINIKLVDNAKWKLDLDMFMVVVQKFKKYQYAWIDNRARTYNLVLQNCPPDVEAEIKDQSTWNFGKDKQNMVTLLRMIRDITHNMKESKQGVMAIVECVVKMNTTAQNSSETTEEYFNIFEAQRNTVDDHEG